MVRQPNIVLIMSDQLRFDALGCNGNRAIRTPNLDRLAEEGVRFEHCYVNGTICTPSRASIMTGKSVLSHGSLTLRDELDGREVMFPSLLRDLGYQTALFGKLNVSSSSLEARFRHPNDGFDVYEWCHSPFEFYDSPYNAYAKWLKERDEPFYRKYEAEGPKLVSEQLYRDISQNNDRACNGSL